MDIDLVAPTRPLSSTIPGFRVTAEAGRDPEALTTVRVLAEAADLGIESSVVDESQQQREVAGHRAGPAHPVDVDARSRRVVDQRASVDLAELPEDEPNATRSPPGARSSSACVRTSPPADP